MDNFEKIIQQSPTRCDSLQGMLEGEIFDLDGKEFDTSKLTIICVDTNNSSMNLFRNQEDPPEIYRLFSDHIVMNNLSENDLIDIVLESDLSPLKIYKEFFQSLNVELIYNEDFIDYLASQSIKDTVGAKSIKIILDSILKDALYDVITGDYEGITLKKPESENDKCYQLIEKKEPTNDIKLSSFL